MTMISTDTVSAWFAALQQPRGQSLLPVADPDCMVVVPPSLAIAPERPPMPDAASWVTALLLAIGLLLLWAWLCAA